MYTMAAFSLISLLGDVTSESRHLQSNLGSSLLQASIFILKYVAARGQVGSKKVVYQKGVFMDRVAQCQIAVGV